MLDIIKSSEHNNPVPRIVVNGRGSKHRLKAMNRLERACFGADLVTGEAHIWPSLVQAAYLAQSTAADIRAELKYRAELAATSQAEASQAELIALNWVSATKEEKEQAIRKIGVADVWDTIAAVTS